MYGVVCFKRQSKPTKRATEPGRGSNVYELDPCVLRSRKLEKRPTAGEEKHAIVRNECYLLFVHTVFVDDTHRLSMY